jgi:enoyl-CoA hydratase/carnithine racemase
VTSGSDLDGSERERRLEVAGAVLVVGDELTDAVQSTAARCLVVTGAAPALFVKRGLCCDVAGLGRLAGVVGRDRPADLLFTGRMVDAGEAAGMGLVSRVVPHEDLLPTALAFAGEIASNPPLAVQSVKRGLREALDPDWRALGAWVSETLAELFRTDDHREGVAAFLEKREPRHAGS